MVLLNMLAYPSEALKKIWCSQINTDGGMKEVAALVPGCGKNGLIFVETQLGEN